MSRVLFVIAAAGALCRVSIIKYCEIFDFSCLFLFCRRTVSAHVSNPGNGPARFSNYEQNAGGKRVVLLLKDVMKDSKNTEDETIRSDLAVRGVYFFP